jgi:hypothetical protein
LVIRFISNLQVVTEVDNYTIDALYNSQSHNTSLFRLSALVLTDL